MGYGLHSCGSEQRQETDCCERGNEPSGSVKGEYTLWSYLLKKRGNCVLWVLFFSNFVLCKFIFPHKLYICYESWSNVFNDGDLDSIFNNFLNTYLRIYCNSFPLEKVYLNNTKEERDLFNMQTNH